MPKTVLITGTSSGLGRATAEVFHDRGWNVVATMRSTDVGSELARQDRSLVTRLDVQDHESIRSAVEAGIAQFGRIDALVNNAGYGAYGPLEATPFEKIQRQFDVNVLGLLATTRALIPHLRANRSGTIVNISSVGGRVTFPLGTLYHGTKFAVEGLSESLHYELLPLGIRVKVVEPGGMPTDFGGRSLDFSNDEALAEYQPIVQGVLGALGPMVANGSAPEVIAEAVYEATVDESDRIRYAAGADAVQMISQRDGATDDEFLAGMRAQFGVAA